MSMEMYVLSDRRLMSMQDWQRSIDALGFVLRLPTARPFSELRGALPVEMPQGAHFECDHWDVEDIRQTYPDIYFDGRWTYALAFRWGGDLDGACAAYMAAAGYARAVNGGIFDCQEGELITLQRAVQTAKELKDSKPIIEAAVRSVMQRLKRES